MKRWTLRILLLLFLGAVTTVIIAWTFAVTKVGLDYETMNDNRASEERHIRWWRDHTPETWARPPHLVMREDYFGLSHERYFDQDFRTNRVSADVINAVAHMTAGWPARDFEGRADMTLNLSTLGPAPSVESGLKVVHLSWLGLKPERVPYHPIWTGALINTALYALLWAGLLHGFTLRRRAARRRRGRCPMCAYDLRGEFKDGCSECGWGRDA